MITFVYIKHLIHCEFTRARRALENRQTMDDDRMNVLERMVKETSQAAAEAERKYEEVRIEIIFFKFFLFKIILGGT